jgi:hypothetical protein
MNLFLEILFIWSGEALVVGLILGACARRLKKNQEWFTGPPQSHDERAVTPQIPMLRQVKGN